MPKHVIKFPGESDFRVQSDLHTMTEAAKIRKDKGRMDAVRKLAKDMLSDLASLSKEKKEKEEE